MPTELTDPNNNGLLEFTQKCEDVDGDTVLVTVELDQINGNSQSGSARNPSWLSYSTSSSLSSGTREVDINIEIDASGLGTSGTTYTFQMKADDGLAVTTKTFTLEVFNPNQLAQIDGSKFYLLGNGNDKVYQASAGTAFDIGTLSFNKNKAVTESSNPYDLFIRPNGTRVFVGPMLDNTVYQYDLSTAWDLNSMSSSNDGSLDVTSEGGWVGGIEFKFDGTKMYLIETSNDKVHSYDLSTPWDITTASVNQAVGSFGLSNPSEMAWSIDGTSFYLVGGGSIITEFTVPTAFDISGYSTGKNLDVSGKTGNVGGIAWKPDGKKLYFGDAGGFTLYQYGLSTAWDLNTASFEKSVQNPNDNSVMDMKWGVA